MNRREEEERFPKQTNKKQHVARQFQMMILCVNLSINQNYIFIYLPWSRQTQIKIQLSKFTKFKTFTKYSYMFPVVKLYLNQIRVLTLTQEEVSL